MNTPHTITAERRACADWRERHGIPTRSPVADAAEHDRMVFAMNRARFGGVPSYAPDADEQRRVNVAGMLR